MDADTGNGLLPQEYKKAAAVLEKIFSAHPLPGTVQGTQQLLHKPEVSISKGFNVGNFQPDSSRDVLQITVQSPTLVESEQADAVGKMALHVLNEIEAVRNEAILVSPHEYLAQGKERLGELQRVAKESNIPGSQIDYTKAVIFNPNLSRNQQQEFATQLIEQDNVTQVRVNIPTNPNNREAAAALANKVATDLTRRLPEIKTEMINRIKKKNYIPKLTPEMEQHLQNHELKAIVQQQGNWTSVFLDIRSPEQKLAQQNPGHISDPVALRNTNMLSKITDEKSRFRLAARAVMFEGKHLSHPAPFFMDVAGSEDIKNGLGKMMHYLKKSKPELKEKIDALMEENFLKSPNQWNLPPEQQDIFKQSAQVWIDPDHPDVLKIKLHIKKGKAQEIINKISDMGIEKATPAPALADINTAIAEQIIGDDAHCGCKNKWAGKVEADKAAAKDAGNSLAV